MTDQRYDVVVIGAGVCGAVAAWRLASSGVRVLMLEAGRWGVDRTALVGNYAADPNHGSPYHDGAASFAPTEDTSPRAYYVQVGARKFKSTYLRRVGGSTWHFLGNTPRFLPADLELEKRYGVGINWPLDYADLEPYYCQAERYLGVSGDHVEWDDPALGFRSQPFPMSQI